MEDKHIEDKIHNKIKYTMEKGLKSFNKAKLFTNMFAILVAGYGVFAKEYALIVALVFIPFLFKLVSNQFLKNKQEYDNRRYKIYKEIVVRKYIETSMATNDEPERHYYYIVTKRDGCIYLRLYNRDFYTQATIDDEIYVVILDEFNDKNKDIVITKEILNQSKRVKHSHFKNINGQRVLPLRIGFAFTKEDLNN